MPPFTPAMARRHKKGMDAKQVRQWCAVAASVYDACIKKGGDSSACEGKAITQANGVTGTPKLSTKQAEPTLQLITARLNTQALRYEMLDGRQYLVAQVVPIIAGVLNGHYVPEEEIATFVDAWNDVPLCLGHPHNEYGDHISGRNPAQLEQSPGRFFGAHMDGPRLLGEVWLDVDKCMQMGGTVLATLQQIEAGERLECSTAFYSEMEPQAGRFQGKPYHGIHRHLRPDHLALLPDDIGACSLADGCGIRAHCAGACGCPATGDTMQVQVRSSARHPTFSGTESTAWSAPSLADCLTAFHASSDEMGMTVADLPMPMKRKIAGLSLLGDPAADTERDLLMFPVVNPRTGKLNAGALRAVLSGRGASADIPDAAKTSAQNMARRLLNSEFGAKLEPQADQGRIRSALHTLFAFAGLATTEPADESPTLTTHLTHADIADALCAALLEQSGTDMPMMYGSTMLVDVLDDYVIYKDQGELYRQAYTIDDQGLVQLTGEPEDVQRNTVYLPTGGDGAATAGGITASQAEGGTMPTKSEMVQSLIVHAQTSWTEEDTATLEGMVDTTLTALLAEADKRTPQDTPPAREEALTLTGLKALLDERDQALEGKLTALTQQQSEHAERQHYTAALTVTGWTQEECASMPLTTLKKVAQTVAPASYAGMGYPAFTAEESDQLPDDDPKSY